MASQISAPSYGILLAVSSASGLAFIAFALSMMRAYRGPKRVALAVLGGVIGLVLVDNMIRIAGMLR